MSSGKGSPFNLLSHITSLIKPIASVVLASSKNNKVLTGGEAVLFSSANFITSLTLHLMSCSVMPP